MGTRSTLNGRQRGLHIVLQDWPVVPLDLLAWILTNKLFSICSEEILKTLNVFSAGTKATPISDGNQECRQPSSKLEQKKIYRESN